MQSNLKCSKQISRVVQKLKNRITGLNKLKYLVPYHTRNVIVTGIFNSVLIYCLPLYGGCSKGQVKELQVLQNRAGQIVCHEPPFTNRKELYDKLGWMTAYCLPHSYPGFQHQEKWRTRVSSEVSECKR